jgi:mono/diheme cytochrome c family protein
VMPAWVGRVSDQDIEDVITWYQALWPADTYQAWQRAYAPDQVQDRSGKSKG